MSHRRSIAPSPQAAAEGHGNMTYYQHATGTAEGQPVSVSEPRLGLDRSARLATTQAVTRPSVGRDRGSRDGDPVSRRTSPLRGLLARPDARGQRGKISQDEGWRLTTDAGRGSVVMLSAEESHTVRRDVRAVCLVWRDVAHASGARQRVELPGWRSWSQTWAASSMRSTSSRRARHEGSRGHRARRRRGHDRQRELVIRGDHNVYPQENRGGPARAFDLAGGGRHRYSPPRVGGGRRSGRCRSTPAAPSRSSS
jgi:hypothetical protein